MPCVALVPPMVDQRQRGPRGGFAAEYTDRTTSRWAA